MNEPVHQFVDHLFRRQSGRMISALVSRFGMQHLQLAEDVVQESLVKAMRHWPFYGVPDDPEAWLARVAHNRALDLLRRDAALRNHEPALRAWAAQRLAGSRSWAREEHDEDGLDEQLQLMFACCDPENDLPRHDQVAIMLRALCGFGIEEVARAFLIDVRTIQQRIVRAKRRLRDQQTPLTIPDLPELESRLDPVLEAIYLIFNEGYAAHRGEAHLRHDLMEEALRLTSMLLRHKATASPVVDALMALLLYQMARSPSRTDEAGTPLLLDEQDRTRWDRSMIARGMQHLKRAQASENLTAWHLEAGIAAVHAQAQSFDETDWPAILDYYNLLAQVKPGPVVELNRAVAAAFVHGWVRGLAMINGLDDDPSMRRYHLFHAARGEILRRAGRRAEAAACLQQALDLASSEPERTLLRSKLSRCAP